MDGPGLNALEIVIACAAGLFAWIASRGSGFGFLIGLIVAALFAAFMYFGK